MLYVRGHFDTYNSYGILTVELCSALVKLGVNLRILPQPGANIQTGKYSSASHPLNRFKVPYNTLTDKELIILPPATALQFSKSTPFAKKRIRLTMFESPILHPDWTQFENTCESLILPCQGNAVGFHASGIKVPLYTIPLGYDNSVYHFSPMNMDGPCVFGIGGRINSITDSRKGAVDAVNLFKKAFPTESDVRLEVKTLDADEAITNSTDSRIKFIRDNYTKTQLFDWYKGLTAYLSMSRSEGWGLMQMDAMVTGRPIIGTRFLGIKEFVPRRAMFETDWTTEPAKIHPLTYENPGCWSVPTPESVIEQMRKVYFYRRLAQERGVISSQIASKYTWENSARSLLSILTKLKYL